MTKRIQHITTILLLLLMVCSGKAWADTWDGTTPSALSGTTITGSGTEADPYLIQSAVDLAYFGKIYPSNTQWWKLTTDVDLDNKTWSYGQNKSAFKGHFDGDGHTVSNISIPVTSTGNYGFFSIVEGTSASERAEIKNITLSNVNITSENDLSGGTNIGGLAGRLKYAVVTNVRVQGGTVTVSGSKNANICIGNMAGTTSDLSADEANVDFSGCYSENVTVVLNGNVLSSGNVYASNFFGYPSHNTNLSDCHVVNSTVTTTSGGTIVQDKSFCVGGLIGAVNNLKSLGKTGDITNCSVTGQTINLTSYDPASSNNYFKNNLAVGGAIGRIWEPFKVPQTIYFSGTINAPKATVGPVIGIIMKKRDTAAFVYDDYSGENMANVSTTDRDAAFNTWSYGNYLLGISSDLLSSGKQLNITSSDVDANGYVTIGDISGWKNNKIGTSEKASKTIIWYTANNSNVSTESAQGIYPQWSNVSTYPSYYMYYLQGVNRGTFSPASYNYTLQLHDWPSTASIQVEGDANAGASYNTNGGTVTTNPNRITATNVTASAYNGFTSHASVDNSAMTITAYYTKQYNLQLVGAPSTGVSVTIDHDYNNGTFTSGTYITAGTVEVTPSFTETDVHVAPVDGYTISTTVDDANSTITVTYERITYSVTMNQPATGGSIKLWNALNQPLAISLSGFVGDGSETVYMLATPADGYVLSGWNVTDADGNAVAVTNNSFTMPAKNVSVTATFEAVPSLKAGNYVVIQSASVADKYLKVPVYVDGATVTTVDNPNDTESLMKLVRYEDYDGNKGGFWLNGVTNTDSWVGYPQNGSNNLSVVSTSVHDVKNASGGKNGYGYGWAGNYSISKCGTDANGTIYQLTDINYNCLNRNSNFDNRTIVLQSNNTYLTGSNGSTDASKWYIHVVTPYTVSITGDATGTVTYNGTNLYGAAKTQSHDGTYYFEGEPVAGDFTAGAVTNYTAGTVTVDNTAHTITLNYTAKCANPTITRNGNDFTFSCSFPTTGVTIKYTTDGSDPENGTVYDGTAVHADVGTTLKVIAMATGYDNSDVVEYFVSQVSGAGTMADPYLIVTASQLDYIKSELGAYYRLDADIDASSFNGVMGDFTGHFDGNFKTITGLQHPLFCSVTGEVKNVTLDNVTITSDKENVGAIANEASGNARIYNCQVLASGSKDFIANPANEDKPFASSSAVSGSGAVGGIVGLISGNARVINCVSYADVSGGTYGAGIVGKYEGDWLTDKGTTVSPDRNFVMNCLMLGDVKSGTNQAPVVGGATITTGISTYNYFRYPSMPNIASMTQNGALSVETDMWLKRYEFFRSVLNTHRDLAAVYCFNYGTLKTEMAKWTIDESISPWPILKAHDENTTKTLSRTIPNTGNANEGNLITNGKRLLDEDDPMKELEEDVTQRYNMNVGSGGYLTVNLTINDQTYNNVQLPITDMDYAHYDYTWGKVILPHANEFTGWTRDYDYVCIGWKITGVTGGTPGTFEDYNFADRNCTDKDLYSKSGYIFAQGGQYIVPYGVTGINIEAHFAKAYYLADEYYDMDISGIKVDASSQNHSGTAKGNGGKRPTTYHGKTVYTSIATAWAAMSDNYKPHDQAIVLVGNYHYSSNMSETYKTKGCTLMSVDEDNDQEPDYCWQFSLVGNNAYQKAWPAMRWDFVPLLGSGVFQMCGAYTAGITLPRTLGWWEMTETSLVRTYEFEVYDTQRATKDYKNGINAWIFNGGYHQAMVRCKSGTDNKYLSYIKLGGNVFIKDFHPGNHSEGTGNWTIRPINITGGEIKNCFMTGMKAGDQIITTDANQPNNVRFYCAGGKLHKYLSCYMERPVVDATMHIDHAIIDKFFGGGTSPVSPVSGDIDIQIDNSLVNQFCGGPEFGDMVEGKTITVKAKGTTFGEYFGAGYGGTAFTLIKYKEYSDKDLTNQNNPADYNGYIKGGLALKSDANGICIDFEYETLMNARGQVCERCFIHRALLSLATTRNVTSTIEDCTVLGNFYGGGCQGKVDGTITSSLKNCDVRGSVFGGGYKADIPAVNVMGTTMNNDDYSKFNPTFGFFTPITYPATTEYKWIAGTENGKVYKTNQTITTITDMTQMGVVEGAIDLTITNGTVGGSVYGGGNESLSKNNTSVKILGTAEVGGNVYGGGNAAEVQGTTKVQIGDECITTP